MIKILNESEMLTHKDKLIEIYRKAMKLEEKTAQYLGVRIENSIKEKLNTVIITVWNEKINEMMGFVYGFDFKPENWWALQIKDFLPLKKNVDWFENTFELNELMISPEYQGKGYGKKLMNELEKNIFHRYILLSTKKNNNTKVIDFYHKLGYYNIIDPFNYVGNVYDTSIIMCLDKNEERS